MPHPWNHSRPGWTGALSTLSWLEMSLLDWMALKCPFPPKPVCESMILRFSPQHFAPEPVRSSQKVSWGGGVG